MRGTDDRDRPSAGTAFGVTCPGIVSGVAAPDATSAAAEADELSSAALAGFLDARGLTEPPPSRPCRWPACSVPWSWGCGAGAGRTRRARPSPMRLIVSANTMMKKPGHQNSHGRVENEFWYSLMSWPSDTLGGWMPNPRNDSAASRIVAVAMSSVALTMTTPIALGRMCLNMIDRGRWRQRHVRRRRTPAHAGTGSRRAQGERGRATTGSRARSPNNAGLRRAKLVSDDGRHHDRGDRDEDLGAALQDEVGAPAVEAGEGADDHANRTWR